MVTLCKVKEMYRNQEAVAVLLARKLKDHGVKYLFGIPGGPSIPLLKAFSDNGMEFILTSHESAAAVMADVTARLTGITGVCHSTFGPGATNLSTGVGGAFLDRSPMLALTTVVPDSWAARTTQMNIDHQALYSAVTKATCRLSPENATMVIENALRVANEEYPGPVHIAIPSDIAGKHFSINPKPSPSDNNSFSKINLASPRAAKTISESLPEELIKKVLQTVESSRKPIIAVGLTAARLGISDMLMEFLSEREIPVVVTPMAKGVIPFDHPCFAGVLFHALSDKLKTLTDKTDLIVGLGYDPVEFNYESWMPSVPIIHFNTLWCDLPISKCTQFISSPDQWFSLLSGLHSSREMISSAANVRETIKTALESVYPGFSPVEAIKILNDALPDDAIVTADVGSHLHLLGQQWRVSKKGRLIMTNGWSSMGFGIPAANAAALCMPGRTVVCVTGDGGMMMSAGEVLTARRYGLKVIIVVLADKELNLIKLKELKRDIATLGVDLYSGSLFQSTAFLGVRVIRADNPSLFKTAVSEALQQTGPVIIEVAIDSSAYEKLVVI